MNHLNYIVWDPNPEIFSIGGWELRWYGLLFALGFLIAQQIMFYIYRQEGKPERDVEALTFFMVIATIVGARLGHVLFYEPEKYFAEPLSILRVWEGGLASHGAAIGILIAIYLYVNYLIKIDWGKFEIKKRKRSGQNYLWVVDRLVIVVALVGALIRMGNFINSEIVGVETNTDYGVVFARDAQQVLKLYGQGTIEGIDAHRVEQQETGAETPLLLELGSGEQQKASPEHPVLFEINFARGISQEAAAEIIENELRRAFLQSARLQEDIALPGGELHYRLQQNRGVVTAEILVDGKPRHPAQLYESLSSFLIFIALFLLWKRRKENTAPGLIFGIFLIVLFGLRFIYEFVKENQVDFEDTLTLNMGQILSIPMVLAGIVILIWSLQQKPDKKKSDKPLSTSGS